MMAARTLLQHTRFFISHLCAAAVLAHIAALHHLSSALPISLVIASKYNIIMSSAEESAPIEWKPPAKIESLFAATAGNKFAAINSPVAGAREERELPEGSAPVQLYSLFTPNGMSLFLMRDVGYLVDTVLPFWCNRAESKHPFRGAGA
jgi:hypothetical protein